LFAKHILQERPAAKIDVQYENDDLGRDYVKGLKQGLGDKAITMIVKELSHELSDPTIDAQIVDSKGAGADVLIQFTQSRFAAQGIRVAAGLNWHPVHMLASNAGSNHVHSSRRRSVERRDHRDLGEKSGGSDPG
jgi:branched-chain amino acid transport system substrate-binding protein